LNSKYPITLLSNTNWIRDWSHDYVTAGSQLTALALS
jgi:hypothetical protein